MSPDSSTFVESSEHVARILHREWIVDGVLQVNAFALGDGETYISVNRPAIETFAFDISDFVRKHPLYMASEESYACHLATLQVSEVRKMEVRFKDKVADLAIEVEPRDTHYKSHAGIFIRVEGKNIKGGQKRNLAIGEGQVVSYEVILLKVQHQLLAISTLERKRSKHLCLHHRKHQRQHRNPRQCLRRWRRGRSGRQLESEHLRLNIEDRELAMRKEFNITGSCYPQWHYMVNTEERFKAVVTSTVVEL